MQSTVVHVNVGFGVFAARIVSRGKTIEASCGSLVYTDLSKRQLLIKEYRDGTMAVLISTLI